MLWAAYTGLLCAVILRPAVSSVLYVSGVIGFDAILSHVDGPAYFPLCASADLFVISLIDRYCVSERAISLIKLSILSMSLNLMGLLFYWLYMPAEPYQYSFCLLYACAIIVIVKGDNGHEHMGWDAIRVWRVAHRIITGSRRYIANSIRSKK